MDDIKKLIMIVFCQQYYSSRGVCKRIKVLDILKES